MKFHFSIRANCLSFQPPVLAAAAVLLSDLMPCLCLTVVVVPPRLQLLIMINLNAENFQMLSSSFRFPCPRSPLCQLHPPSSDEQLLQASLMLQVSSETCSARAELSTRKWQAQGEQRHPIYSPMYFTKSGLGTGIRASFVVCQ